MEMTPNTSKQEKEPALEFVDLEEERKKIGERLEQQNERGIVEQGSNATNGNSNNQSWANMAYTTLSYTFPFINSSMFTFCFPYMKHTTDKNKSSISRVKSPYENFNGTSPFVVTVLGPPQVGKTTLCGQFRKSFTNIYSKHLFKFSSIPPDIQVSCLIEGEELQLGLYDTVGMKDPRLLEYLLQGQSKGDDEYFEEFVNESKSITQHGVKPLKRRTVDSEGFIVLFDLTKPETFSTACALVDEIFEYFSFDTQQKTTAPCTVILLGNMKDLPNRQVSSAAIQQFVSKRNGYVIYFEMTALSDSIQPLAKTLSLKLKEQRSAYVQLLQDKPKSFWD